MKWQDAKVFFKKVSRSRTLWIGGGSSIFAIFAYIALLAGVTITTSGDVICGNECVVYTNITSTYWEFRFNSSEFTPVYFDKEPISYKVYVPTIKSYAENQDEHGYWRSLKAGDYIYRKNKYHPNPNRFKIVIEKKDWETIKYGVQFSLTDIDPYLYSTNVQFIGDKKYEKLCDPIYQDKTIAVPYTTMSKCDKENKSCEPREITLYTYEKVKEQVGCKLNGKVNDSEQIIEVDRFFCGLDNKGIVCDEARDSSGGGADGDGNGVCSEGETCVRH
jgi:hypothetical protein